MKQPISVLLVPIVLAILFLLSNAPLTPLAAQTGQTAQTAKTTQTVQISQGTSGRLILPTFSSSPDPRAVEAWKENKFSMFIHFGIYSALAGVWEGRPVTRGLSEQIQAHAGIYSDTYAHVADSFDPVRWNADSIALLAKDAGMRSIVITSKHHDGFCMFHSAYTDFNIVDATPFKRDVVKELSDACKRHGLRFGVYFSLIDWHFPQASPISSHNSDFITPEHHQYNMRQVTELMTKYGTISEIWFDMGSQSASQSKELADLVHSLQPDCMISSRIGNDQGDFTVMGDNQEPNYKIGVPWQ
jgi:alpha-L-fucosidase